MTDAGLSAYETFAANDGPRLRQAMVARFGLDVGVEAAADAMAWAWEHWTDVELMANRLGYLYRVGQSSARRYHRWSRRLHLPQEAVMSGAAAFEPGLREALLKLPEPHRVAVILVKAHDWSHAEVAAVTGRTENTTRTHVHRGLERLRRILGADHA